MFLEIKQVEIGYSEPLLSNINAGLELGQLCLIIGNNGVGKTTLLKSILNQIPVLKGELFLNNKAVQNYSAKELAEQIAVVYSKAKIPANYTVSDLISLGKFQQYPFYFELKKKDKEEVSSIISQLQLEQYKNLSLQKLSDGNLQKAFIGRALSQNSPFTILDEPTAHLDEENKVSILKLLRNLAKKKNKLILFTSHDWRLAKEFADRIWYIKNQQLYDGVAEDILLNHSQLTQANLFNFHPNFVSPVILASDFEKVLLYSTLQKNFNSDLSKWKIEKKNEFWSIQNSNFQENANTFENIIKIIRNND